MESGMRAILNFGHTFAHAVEMLTQYKKHRHGEAVAMGMVAACALGRKVQEFPESSSKRLETPGFRRQYRDHRLEWMLKSGGLDIVLEGMKRGNIRFNWPFVTLS